MRRALKKKELVQACFFALKHNLGLSPGETVLIVSDRKSGGVVEAMEEAVLSLTDRTETIFIPALAYAGQEPPDTAAEAMLLADVVLLLGAKSMSWTQARVKATEKGVRIASMPGIKTETVLRTFPQDYGKIRERVNRLCDLLDKARSIHVATALGTDIALGVEGRKGRGRRGGIYTEKGAWGNLPCGEAFIAPVEGTASGLYVVDASHSGIGKLGDPVCIEVEAGRAQRIVGGVHATALMDLLKKDPNPGAFNIAEFGIGCNDKAEICGITLEDEKALGTCHIALGGNSQFGGQTEAGIHLDGVMRKPTVTVDELTIMRQGKLLPEFI